MRIIWAVSSPRKGHSFAKYRQNMCEPHVKPQKNGDVDAEAIAESAMRPAMRFVAVKSQASDIQTSRHPGTALSARTTGAGAHRADQSPAGALLVRGIVAPQGRRKLEEELTVFADADEIEGFYRRRQSFGELRRSRARKATS